MGIDCIQWYSSRHDRAMIEDRLADKAADAWLIVVSADMVGSDEFVGYIESI